MAVKESNTSDREIVISRVFDAPRELVWKAWTDPKHIAMWWGPKGFVTTITEMDFKVGGIWALTMHGPDGATYPNRSVFTKIVKPELVVFEHTGHGKGGPEVTHESFWTFVERGDKTEVTIRMIFESATVRDKVVQFYGAVEGGHQTLERLSKQLVRMTSTEEELLITRVFDAPRERVFKVWTDPKHLVNWWGPKGFTAPVCKVDFRVGGIFHYCMRSPDGKDYWNKGVFREIIVPEKIVSLMFFSDEKGSVLEPSHYGFAPDFPSEMLDTVTFTEIEGGKTKLTLHRQTPISISKRYMEDQGWNQSLDRFAAELKKA